MDRVEGLRRRTIYIRSLVLALLSTISCLIVFVLSDGIPEPPIFQIEMDNYSLGDYKTLIDHNFHFEHVSPICQTDDSTEILMMVFSRPENKNLRKAIRETWGLNNKYIKVVFIFGLQFSLDYDVAEEAKKYKDIVQGSFWEMAANLPYKYMAMLKFAVYHCNKAKYVLKAEDNIVVNVNFLKDYLPLRVNEEYLKDFIMCNIPRINNHIQHPRHCRFEFVIFSFNVTHMLYKTGQKTDYFYIFDNIYANLNFADHLNIKVVDMKDKMLINEHIDNIIERNTDVNFDQLVSNVTNFIFTPGNLKDWQIRSLWENVKLFGKCGPLLQMRHINSM